MTTTLDENIRTHVHRYQSPFISECSECVQVDQTARSKQNAILCAATSVGLPRFFARDLLIDCETVAQYNPPEFALLLRECGSQIAFDKPTIESAKYWIDNDDSQAFFIYKITADKYGSTHSSLERVRKFEFVAWLDSHK